MTNAEDPTPQETLTVESDLTEDEVLTILNDECDGKPHQLLRHNEAKYVLAEWKARSLETNFAYDAVMEEINWRGVNMPKGKFEDSLEELWETINDEDDDENDEMKIPDMSSSEFKETFDWHNMKDREMARKCHFWMKENKNIIFTNDRVFVYENGVWVEDKGRIARMLQKLLGGHYGDNVKKEFLNGYVRAHDEYRVEWEDMGIRGSQVAVKNGLLDLIRGEVVRELKPEDYAIIRLPVEWKGPDAERSSWNRFIQQSVEAEGRKTIQEFSGLCLHTNDYPFKKAMMLLGGGDNGKGVYENVMTALLGRDNVSHDDLTDMAGGQFGLQRLRHKTANINSDIRGGKIEETSMFKKLTGRDRVRVEPKYETAFEMENPAKMIFAANSAPKMKNAERAFYRRWLFVQFPHRFTNDPDDDFMDAVRDLDDKIIETELPGVLAWAVEGYQRLIEQGRFTGEQNADEIRRQWHEYQDTTATFVRNYVTAGNPQVDDPLDHNMRVDTLYDYYEKYIRTTPTAAKSKQGLHAYITADHAYPDAETRTSRAAAHDGEEAVRVWEGIYLPKEKREEIRDQFVEDGT